MTDQQAWTMALARLDRIEGKLDGYIERGNSQEGRTRKALARADEALQRVREHRESEHGRSNSDYDPWIANERTQLWYSRWRIATALLVLAGLAAPALLPVLTTAARVVTP